jgi:hypothetical protein
MPGTINVNIVNADPDINPMTGAKKVNIPFTPEKYTKSAEKAITKQLVPSSANVGRPVLRFKSTEFSVTDELPCPVCACRSTERSWDADRSMMVYHCTCCGADTGLTWEEVVVLRATGTVTYDENDEVIVPETISEDLLTAPENPDLPCFGTLEAMEATYAAIAEAGGGPIIGTGDAMEEEDDNEDETIIGTGDGPSGGIPDNPPFPISGGDNGGSSGGSTGNDGPTGNGPTMDETEEGSL